MDFIRAPLSQIPLILNKQKELLTFSIISNVFILSLVLFGGFYFNDIIKVLLLVSISQIIYLSLLLIWIFRIASKHDKTL